LFDQYEANDSMSVHELSRILKRKPLLCKQDTVKLARYLIETKGKVDAKSAEKAEERLSVVLDRMAVLVGNYAVFDDSQEADLSKSLVSVFVDNNSSLRNSMDTWETCKRPLNRWKHCRA